MTDLEKMIDEINNTSGLNQSEKAELRQLARDLATAKGELGPEKKKQIRDAIARMKNKPTTTRPPASTTRSPGNTTRPPGGTTRAPGNTTRPTTKAPGGTTTKPPGKTDLEKMIDEINSTTGLNQSQKAELRQFARSLATEKGALSASDKQKIRDRIKKLKQPSTTKPSATKPGPTSPSEKSYWQRYKSGWDKMRDQDRQSDIDFIRGILKNPNNEKDFKALGNNKQRTLAETVEDGNLTGDERERIRKAFEKTEPGTTKPGGGSTNPPSDGGDRWKEFKDGYSNLSDEDKRFIKNLIGFAPNNANYSKWQKLSNEKKDALHSAVLDYKISDDERKNLKKLFGKDGTNPTSTKKPKDDDDDFDDVPGDGDDGDGDGVEEGEGDGTSNVPGSSRRNRTKIKFPEDGKTTVWVPTGSNADRINMPNIEQKTKKEINKLTKELISMAREFIEGGQTFSSIDLIPSDYIFNEDDLLYYIGDDPNVPITPGDPLAELRDMVEVIANLIESKLLYKASSNPNPSNYVWYNGGWFNFGGDTQNLPSDAEWFYSEEYGFWVSDSHPPPEQNISGTPSYKKYLNLFDLLYTPGGAPRFTFGVDLEDDIMVDEIKLVRISLENDE